MVKLIFLSNLFVIVVKGDVYKEVEEFFLILIMCYES